MASKRKTQSVGYHKQRIVGLRLSDEGHRNLERLAEETGSSRSGAVEAAVLACLLILSSEKKNNSGS